MPVSFEMFPDRRMILVTSTGIVKLGEVSQNYQEFCRSPGAHTFKYFICDISGAERIDAQYDGSRILADVFAADTEDSIDPWLFAIVTQNLGHIAILSDFAARLSATSPTECRVKSSFAEALDWFGLDHADFPELGGTTPADAPRA